MRDETIVTVINKSDDAGSGRSKKEACLVVIYGAELGRKYHIDGREMTINARFKKCSAEELEASDRRHEEMTMRMEELDEKLAEMRLRILEYMPKMELNERPILGVYEGEGSNGAGMVIKSVIRGKGAEAAGLQEGDVVIRVDGKTISDSENLRGVLAGRKPERTSNCPRA